MDERLVVRAIAAASSLAPAMDLEVGEAVVLQNSNKLALRLLPCDSFARTALVGREVADFEVGVAQRLAAVSAPIASLDARVNPRVHVRDGFLETLHGAGQAIRRSGHIDQLLHGEPHPGNLLSTTEGLLFIDFETCCRGPIEFDVAHVPEAVSVHYPGLERALLQECRRLVLAMVAAWRWDVRDEFRTDIEPRSRFSPCCVAGFSLCCVAGHPGLRSGLSPPIDTPTHAAISR